MKREIAMEPLLKVQEAADYLRVSRKTVIEYARRGELQGRVIGGRWRFAPEALRQFFLKSPTDWSLRAERRISG